MGTEKEIDRNILLKEAPDFVQIADPLLQKKWIDYELSRRALDENENRFFTFRNKEGGLETIDLKAVAIKGMILKRGGTMKDVLDANEIRTKVIVKLLANMVKAKNLYYHAFDLHNKEGKAIAQLTPILLDLFGSMNGIEDVKKITRTKYGYILNDGELTKFYNENKALIEGRKAQFLIKSDQYRVATDSGRLSVLNELLTDFQIKYQKFLELDNTQQALVMAREIRGILEQARKEVKGNELKLTVDGKIDITATLHGRENVDRVMRDIPINAIVIGIVAAQSGLDPTVLISQLASSYYKDFNGFNKTVLGKEQIRLPGDLIRSYNWEEIQESNKKFLNEMKPLIIEDVEPMEEKEDILSRLKRLKTRNMNLE